MRILIKILIWLISFAAAFWLVYVVVFLSNENTVKEYSTYCMDKVRSVLWEKLENVSMLWANCAEWSCAYTWGVRYDSTDYAFSCKVYNKDMVDLDLQPLSIAIDDEEVFTGVEVDENSIVIYFSPTWNTRKIATFISELKGSELEEILPLTWYTEEDLNWENEDSRSYKEYQDPSIRPEIETQFDLNWYDTIYLWYPIWFDRAPNIILTFLLKNNLSDKNIILFCTSGSSWIERSVEFLEEYGYNFVASKRFDQGATKKEVREWLKSL